MNLTRITSRDGAPVAVESVGAGPGIVVVHGGGVTRTLYRRLAARLADRFTVHLYDRRGRGDAAPKSPGWTVDEDVDDIAAIQEHTGAVHLIGHSYGGFAALRAAMRVPFERVALYDATVNVGGAFPTGWIPAFGTATRAGDLARALALMGHGMRPPGRLPPMPMGVRVAIGHAFLRTSIGRSMGDLLPTSVPELEELARHDGPAADYAGVTAEVLLAAGAGSGPHYRTVNDRLARAMPHARSVVIPRARHNAINIARPAFVAPFAEFFSSPRRTRSLPDPA
jgi:pimeloyl-ACP methyl ester carboxylesterase